MMKPIVHKLLIALSVVGLALTIVPPILEFKGYLAMNSYYNLMTLGMVMWFATAPFWMKTKSMDDEE